MKNFPGHHRSIDKLLPVRKSLRPKRSRRCIECMRGGRPGLLIKPQVHSLHGDSSGGVHVGRWFKKQSLARYYLPIITIVDIKNKDKEGFSELFVRFSNPFYQSQSQVSSDIQMYIQDMKDSTEASGSAIISNEGPYIITAIDAVDAEDVDLNNYVISMKKSLGMEPDDPDIVVGRTHKSIILRIPFERFNKANKTKLSTISLLLRLQYEVKGKLLKNTLQVNINI